MGLVNYTNITDGEAITANVFNQRFGSIIEQINGGLDSANYGAAGIPVAALSNEVFEKMWPIGSIYINVSTDANPSTYLGFGTWEAYGTGRVMVGVDTGDTDFNAVNKEGGSKELQQHNHATYLYRGTGSSTDSRFIPFAGSGGQVTVNETTANAGTGDSGNLQPYIAVYMWRRTG